MPNVRNYPVGTVGWTGSTMRENQQEDIFLFCDDRLAAINVGPDGTYGSLVYDTNQNNEYDAERSAYLQSAFRVIKRPLGQANAIGFQLGWAGNFDTKGGYFVDVGDGSTTTKGVVTPGRAMGGSGMVATGTVQAGPQPSATDMSSTFTTSNAGASGGLIIGQGSYADGGPFHVGNKSDKHNKGKDADGNPINCLHITTAANFYKNQAQDGPLRFEDQYQQGVDQSIIVPVHLGWTGQDWAWWSTSYFYQPDGPPPPKPPPYRPPTPTGYPLYPGIPTPGPGTYPAITTPSGGPGKPPTNSVASVDLNHGLTNPGGWQSVVTGGYISPPVASQGGTSAGNVQAPPTPATPPAGPQPTPTGNSTSSTGPSYQDSSTQPSEDNVVTGPDGNQLLPPTGYGPGGQPAPFNDPSAGDQGGLFGGSTSGGSSGTGGAGAGGGGPKPPSGNGQTSTSGWPVMQVPNLPLIHDLGPFNPNPPTNNYNATMGSSSVGSIMNMVSSVGALNTSAQTFQATNYAPNATAGGIFNAAASAGALAKGAGSSPQLGGASGFGAQGGSIAGGATGSGQPFSPSTGGAQGDPWIYTASPRDQQMSSTSPKSKYKGGTANGGICFHPAETDLRDAASNGMAPPGVTLNTFVVMTSPNAYFGCGVPELVNGGIKSGYMWGVDATTGDKVFYSVSSSQPKVEAVRFTNTSQRIQWASQRGVNGELAHFNTAARTWTFQDASGYVLCSAGNVGFYGTTPKGQLTVTGSRGGNAALASLLTQLASYGLIVDGTTA